MWKLKDNKKDYYLENKHGMFEVLVDENSEFEDTYEGYFNGEFFISGSLGEVCRYMEGFIDGLDYYK